MSDNKLGLRCWYTVYYMCVSVRCMETNLLIFHVQEHPMDKINNLFIRFNRFRRRRHKQRHSIKIHLDYVSLPQTILILSNVAGELMIPGNFIFIKFPHQISNSKNHLCHRHFTVSATVVFNATVRMQGPPPPPPPTITYQVSESCAPYIYMNP